MKLSNVVGAILFLLPPTIAYNPFRVSTRRAYKIEEPVNLSTYNHEFNPSTLLESRSRNSEIYTKAMVELKRLESKPTCHRLAVQLLMNNCQDVGEMSNEDYQLTYTENHHVLSFANGLTLCDLSMGKFVVSDACTPFTASALLRVYQGGRGNLDVAPQQTSACIETFADDSSQWLTWVNHRDNALTFCRASRLDIDKDETINLHKELTRLMAAFAEGLELDLEHAKHAMAEHTREMNTYFEDSLSHAGQLRAMMQGTMETFSNEVQDVSQTIQSAKGSTVDLQRTVRVLIETVLKTNAEMAAGQEQALVATTDLAESQMAGINTMAEDTIATLRDLGSVVRDQLLPAVISINERHDLIEQKSEELRDHLVYMTDLVNNHTDTLEQARSTTERIVLALEKTTAHTKFWTDLLSFGSTIGCWAFSFATAVSTLVLGNYGVTSTIAGNFRLLGLGFIVGHAMVWLRYGWYSFRAAVDATAPSSVTQLTQQIFGSLVVTPVENELELVMPEEVEIELV